MQKPPVIYFSFANDSTRYLSKLKEESRNIHNALWEHTVSGYIHLVREESVSIRDIFTDLDKYRNKLAIFHFAGHAGSNYLQLDDKEANALGLMQRIGREKNLKLVFLNGCSTKANVKTLLESGVGAIIATSSSIDDSMAMEFASCFYHSLASQHTLEIAFNNSIDFLATNKHPAAISAGIYRHRGLGNAIETNKEFPWGLYIQEGIQDQILGWKLPNSSIYSDTTTKYHGRSFPILKNVNFIGRKKKLEEIVKTLSSENQLVLLNGIGGIGKTALILQFIQLKKQEFRNIAWISYSGSLLSSFVDQIDTIKYSFKERKALLENFLSLSRAMDRTKGKNLLVIDNIEDSADFRKNLTFLPKNWKIILSSRKKISILKTITIDVLPEEDAKTLFLKHYAKGHGIDQVDELLKFIGYHTLAIELLAKTLAKKESLDVPRALHELKTNGLTGFTRTALVDTLHNPQTAQVKINEYLAVLYDLATLTTVETALLYQLAFLSPNFITFADIKGILQIDDKKEEELDVGLNSLVENGWVNKYIEEQNYVYYINPVIQEVVRKKKGIIWGNLRGLVQGLKSRLALDIYLDNPIDKFPWIDYAEYFLEQIKDRQNGEIALLKSNLAKLYIYQGNFRRAVTLLDHVLTFEIEEFGDEDPTVAVHRSHLAVAFSELGDFKKAKFLLEKALASDEKTFGDVHDRVIASKGNLGNVLIELGQYQEATVLLEEVLKYDIEKHGASHSKTSGDLFNLSIAYRKSGNDEESLKLSLEALRLDKKNHGRDHLYVANTYVGLAKTYKHLGQLEEAINCLEEAENIYFKNGFDDNSSYVATCKSDMASIYAKKRNFPKAHSLINIAIESDAETFGNQHPKVAAQYSVVARIFELEGNYPKSVELLRIALQILENAVGMNHPDTIQVLTEIERLKDI